jgi:molecular chaperone IbpA
MDYRLFDALNSDVFRQYTLGSSDNFFENLKKVIKSIDTTNYPPYNIVKSEGMDYRLEIAVAGFTSDQIEVTLQENTLTVSASATNPEEKNEVYLHKGLAKRTFKRTFILSEVKIDNVYLSDGILTINLKHEIPETMQPKKIPIGKKELLLG